MHWKVNLFYAITENDFYSSAILLEELDGQSCLKRKIGLSNLIVLALFNHQFHEEVSLEGFY